MVMVNNVLLSSSSARPLSSRLPRPDDEFAVYDVGYINLIPQSEVHVRVVDAEGQGIAGAAVWVGGSFACVVGGSPEGSAVQVDEEVLPSVSASSTQVQLRGRACPVEEVAKTTSQTGSPAFVVRVTIPAGER
jgi:hypothetical protein